MKCLIPIREIHNSPLCQGSLAALNDLFSDLLDSDVSPKQKQESESPQPSDKHVRKTVTTSAYKVT